MFHMFKKKKTDKELLYEIIERIFQDFIDHLNPDIKNRAVALKISNEIRYLNNKKQVNTGMTEYLPDGRMIITFFPKAFVGELHQRIYNVLIHELIHTFTKDEKAADQMIKYVEFFKNA